MAAVGENYTHYAILGPGRAQPLSRKTLRLRLHVLLGRSGPSHRASPCQSPPAHVSTGTAARMPTPSAPPIICPHLRLRPLPSTVFALPTHIPAPPALIRAFHSFPPPRSTILVLPRLPRSCRCPFQLCHSIRVSSLTLRADRACTIRARVAYQAFHSRLRNASSSHLPTPTGFTGTASICISVSFPFLCTGLLIVAIRLPLLSEFRSEYTGLQQRAHARPCH